LMLIMAYLMDTLSRPTVGPLISHATTLHGPCLKPADLI
jgi:hypothetical protein